MFIIECSLLELRSPLIRKLAIRITNYPDRLGPSGKFIENSTALTCLEIIRLSVEVQYCVMASRTSNQTWSKCLDVGTYCK